VFDPCRLVRQVKKIEWLDKAPGYDRRPLPACWQMKEILRLLAPWACAGSGPFIKLPHYRLAACYNADMSDSPDQRDQTANEKILEILQRQERRRV